MPGSSSKKIFIKYHLLFTLFIALIVLLVCLFLFILPFYNQTIENKKQEIARNDKELEERLNYFKGLKKIKEESDSIEIAEREKLNLILPANAEIPELFLNIDIIVKESGLILSTISASDITPKLAPAANASSPGESESPPESATPPSASPSSDSETGPLSTAEVNQDSSPSTSTKDLKIIQISLTVSDGSYDKLKIFLTKLEKNLRLFDIQSLTFENSFEDIELLINTYYSSLE